jgi:hypothetical protein
MKILEQAMSDPSFMKEIMEKKKKIEKNWEEDVISIINLIKDTINNKKNKRELSLFEVTYFLQCITTELIDIIFKTIPDKDIVNANASIFKELIESLTQKQLLNLLNQKGK